MPVLAVQILKRVLSFTSPVRRTIFKHGCQVKDEKLSIGLFFVPSQLSYNWKTYFTNQVRTHMGKRPFE